MKYIVDWTDDALSALTAIWLQASDRRAITSAQDQLDRLLATNPLDKGRPVSEGLYAIEVHPLRALYEVSDVDRVVTVATVNPLD